MLLPRGIPAKQPLCQTDAAELPRRVPTERPPPSHCRVALWVLGKGPPAREQGSAADDRIVIGVAADLPRRVEHLPRRSFLVRRPPRPPDGVAVRSAGSSPRTPSPRTPRTGASRSSPP